MYRADTCCLQSDNAGTKKMGIGDKRHKVLLSAYACEPNKGSEPGVGWNWAKHLAEKYEIYVITRKIIKLISKII